MFIRKLLTTVGIGVILWMVPVATYAQTPSGTESATVTAALATTPEVPSAATSVPGNDFSMWQNTAFVRSRGSYHSGFRSSSPGFGSSYGSRSTYGSSYGYAPRSSFGSHLFSFGAGWMLGSLFHPFGGYYGYGYHSFSIFGLLFDIFVLYILWRIIRGFFRR